MRKFITFLVLLITFEAGFLVNHHVVSAMTPHAKSLVCAPSGICLSRSEDMLPHQAFHVSTPRNSCRNLTYPNVTGYIDNNTGVRWRVFTGPNCTGIMGTIFANSEGPMTGNFLDSIDSLYRTSLL